MRKEVLNEPNLCQADEGIFEVIPPLIYVLAKTGVSI